VDGSATIWLAETSLDGELAWLADGLLMVQSVSLYETPLYPLKLFRVRHPSAHDQVGAQINDTETTYDHHDTSHFHVCAPLHVDVRRFRTGCCRGERTRPGRLPHQAHSPDRAVSSRRRHGHDCPFRGPKSHGKDQLEHRCR
jgi:hypothetical protein